jgi:hypothetical protein
MRYKRVFTAILALSLYTADSTFAQGNSNHEKENTRSERGDERLPPCGGRTTGAMVCGHRHAATTGCKRVGTMCW